MAELAERGQSHPAPRVALLIGLVDPRPEVQERRFVAGLEVWLTEREIQMGLVDRKDSPWLAEESWLGRIMDRSAVLSSPLKDELFHAADHVVDEDSRIRDYLAGR